MIKVSDVLGSATALARELVSDTHVFLSDLCLLLGRKVVLDVEELSNLLGCLSLDHVGPAKEELGVSKSLLAPFDGIDGRATRTLSCSRRRGAA